MSIDHHSERQTLDTLALDMPGEQMRRLSIGWLSLALGSLVVGGLLTVVIVLSRTPYVQDIFIFVYLNAFSLQGNLFVMMAPNITCQSRGHRLWGGY